MEVGILAWSSFGLSSSYSPVENAATRLLDSGRKGKKNEYGNTMGDTFLETFCLMMWRSRGTARR